MNLFYFQIPIMILIVSLAIGVFLFLKPASIIEIQRKFYEKINWRVEPISMPKEIRNTKIMGLSLILMSLVAAVYLIKI